MKFSAVVLSISIFALATGLALAVPVAEADAAPALNANEVDLIARAAAARPRRCFRIRCNGDAECRNAGCNKCSSDGKCS